MRCARGRWTIQFLAAAALALGACAGPSTEEMAEQAAQEKWAAIQEEKQALDAKRAEVAEARRKLAEAMESEAPEAAAEEGEAMPTVEELQAEVERLRGEAESQADDLSASLVTYLNQDDPMLEGEPPTERQLAVLHMKSEEDIVLAKQWIDEGGDYKRAIEIYNTALLFDPDNEKLKAALAEAEADRYMTKERFAQAKKGMNEREVRSVLGTVNRFNAKDYPERKVKAWFYPTDDAGSAAGVWFREDKKSGEYRVYQVQFEAVKAEDLREG